MTTGPKILVCPLDWGIGHATRCVPVIRELQRQGAQVLVAASGKPLSFLQQEFPGIETINFPGYTVTYASRGSALPLQVLRQSPALLRWIRKEHNQLKDIIKDHTIRGVVSDNRFGLYTEAVPSVFMTHQVFIKTTASTRFLSPFVVKTNLRFIKKYNFCWIPDFEGDPNLSGELSHHKTLPDHCRYIGPQSRFDLIEQEAHEADTNTRYRAVVLLSGPEPQRSILEEKILKQAGDSGIPLAVVQGKPDEGSKTQRIGNIDVFTHLPTNRLARLIRAADFVIARSGYSTVMDLASLKKPAILIPTPGQPEQLYLGQYLQEKGWFRCVYQEDFKLAQEEPRFQSGAALELEVDKTRLELAVSEFLAIT